MSDLRARAIRLAASFPPRSRERREILATVIQTRSAFTLKVSPENLVKSDLYRQVVVVFEDGHYLASPKDLFVGRDWDPKGVDRAAVKRALSRPDVIGVLTYTDRGMYSYMYRAATRLPDGQFLVASRRFHGDTDLSSSVDFLRSKWAQGKGDTAKTLAELDQRLKRHDWWAAMSDAPGVWSSGERDMDEIVEMLVTVDPTEGRALWKKHAPPEFRYPLD